MELNKNGEIVLSKRYYRKNDKGEIAENFDKLCRRVARNIAQAEKNYSTKDEIQKVEDQFYDALNNLEFLPNSPTLMNAGTELQQLSACFTIPVNDSMEGIYDALKSSALVFKSGGGVGFSFTKLRPKNDVVDKTQGVSSGPISFMKVFNESIEQIKQGGKRRGAAMGSIRVDHPDILEFIDCKKERDRLTNFNISICITDAFMKALERGKEYELLNPRTKQVAGKLKAKEVFDKLVENAWLNGEPGILFIDRINKDNPTPSLGEMLTTNPCGEIPLLPFEACNLASINLARMVKEVEKDSYDVDWTRLKKTIKIAIRFLDNVVDMSKFPIPQITEMVKGNRKIGLGVMGFADLLLLLEIKYNSKEGLRFADKLMKFIEEESKDASIELASVRGTFPNFKGSTYDTKGGMKVRNATTNTVAPTGSLSIIANCFSGDTKISLLNGKEEEIRNLVGKDFFVYSYDAKGRRVVSGKASASLTRTNSPLVEVVLDNYEVIKCTPDHKFLLRNGVYKEAKDLKENDRLMPLYRKLDCHGYEKVYNPTPSEKKEYWCYTHRRMVRGDKKDIVHHMNYHTKDNTPTNLLWVTQKEHNEIHLGANNPMKNKEIIDRRKATGWYVLTNESRRGMSESKLGNKNPMKRVAVARKVSEKQTGKTISQEAIQKIKEWYVTHINPFKGKKHKEKSLEQMRFSHKKWHQENANPNTRFDINEDKIKYLRNNEKLSWNKIAQKLNCGISTIKRRYHDKVYNHKVVSIKPLEGTHDVYDLHVEKYHNFALSAGVFVHNCSGGIEPLFAIVIVKTVLGGSRLIEVNPIFEAILKKRNLYSEELMQKIASKNSIQDIEEIPEEIREIFVTSHDIAPDWHIKMQAVFQKHVDNSISKTVNLSHDSTYDDVKKAFLLAYEEGVKGITVYRDGSRDDQVLSVGTKKKVEEKIMREKKIPDVLDGKTHKIKTSQCGNLRLTVNKEPGNGVCEIICTMGQSGDCISSHQEAIGKLASHALRYGVPLKSVIKSLKGIGCPKPTLCSKGALSCLAMAAVKLEEDSKEQVVIKKAGVAKCPECGTELVSGNCDKCPSCGYSTCGS